MVLRIHQGLFPQKIFFRFFSPHKFVSGGNLMNGISFEMASCQVFIGSRTPENSRKFNTLLIITLIYALMS
jgi:hypothetical protein